MSGGPYSETWGAVTWATVWTWAADKATITATSPYLCLSGHQAVGTEDRGHVADTQWI